MKADCSSHAYSFSPWTSFWWHIVNSESQYKWQRKAYSHFTNICLFLFSWEFTSTVIHLTLISCQCVTEKWKWKKEMSSCLWNRNREERKRDVFQGELELMIEQKASHTCCVLVWYGKKYFEFGAGQIILKQSVKAWTNHKYKIITKG